MIRFAVLFGIAALLPFHAQAGMAPEKSGPGVRGWHLLEFGKSYLRIQPPSPETAARYFDRAAATGVTWVMYDVAERYRKGDGIPKNPSKALGLYQQVISHEECATTSATCAWAKFQAGEMLRKGEGAKRDLALSRRYLEDAVQATNDQWPKLALAEVLEATKGREAALRAVALYRESAAAGNTYAAEGLSSLCGRLKLSEC